MPIRCLSAAQVRACLPMPDAIAAMREAFVAVSRGRADLPLRTAVTLTDTRTGLVMPVALRDPDRLVTKLVTVYGENPARGRPLIHGVVVVFDAETGEPSGLLDGQSLTAIRTGAASGLATDLLAAPGASVLGVVGAGVQARTQVEAVCAVRPIAEVRIYARREAQARAVVDDIAGQSWAPAVHHIAPSALAACRGAHIICSATSAPEPVVVSAAVEAGTHVNAIGSYTPQMREVDPDVFSRGRVVVDQVPAAMAEAGEIIAAVARGIIRESDLVELGAVAAGRVSGRRTADEVTVFKSVGLAAQDASAAAWALRRAAATDGGTVIEL